MSNERKIKKFADFVPKFRKILNHLFIVGKIKGGFLRKSKDFEVQIYYTPLKKTIVEIIPIGIELDKLPFKLGDDISVARNWCKVNGHEITFDKKQF